MCLACYFQPISIHAPREGSDPILPPALWRLCLFQSTLPVRGATRRLATRSSRRLISIHAPREGSDVCPFPLNLLGCEFQSTLPVRGATLADTLAKRLMFISIHAPREGSDRSFSASVNLS